MSDALRVVGGAPARERGDRRRGLRNARGRLAALAVLAAVTAACAAQPVPGEPRRPRADLRATVRIAFSPHAMFVFRLWLDPPASCPLVAWDFGDGSAASRESDCEPGAIGPRVYERRHTYRVPGNYVVTATVMEGGRLLARAQTTVQVKEGLPA